MPDVIWHLWSKDQVIAVLLLLTILWVLGVWLSYWVLLRGLDLQRWAEIPRVLFWPVLLFFIFWLLLAFLPHLTEAIQSLTDPNPISDYCAKVTRSILRIATGISLWRCVTSLLGVVHSEFLERKFRAHGKDKERNTAALISSLTRPLAFVLVFAYVAWLFEFNLASYLITFGGLSVALAFALQRLLQNVFSGLSLSLDAPFSTNDLIKVGTGGKEAKVPIYQVVKRGVRVTTVRDIATHEIVYLPNNLLAEEPLVDITRPTDDLRAVIDLGVPYKGADLRQVRGILIDIANGHPHIVGPYGKKKAAILDKVYRLYIRGVFEECFQHFIELARLECEDELNQAVSNLRRKLELWARFVDMVESRGFNREEKTDLETIADALDEEASKVANLTTEWQILLRNCTPRGRYMPYEIDTSDERVGRPAWYIGEKPTEIEQYVSNFGVSLSRETVQEQALKEGSDDEPREKGIGQGSSDELDQTQRDLVQRMKVLEVSLTQLVQGLIRIPDAPQLWDTLAEKEQKLVQGLTRIPDAPVKTSSKNKMLSEDTFAEKTWEEIKKADQASVLSLLRAMRVANGLSKLSGISAETKDTRPAYMKSEFREVIGNTYNKLGQKYGDLMREFAHRIVYDEQFKHGSRLSAALHNARSKELKKEKGFSVELCRTRGEDLYLSEAATQHILDHPLCEATAGGIFDEDERSDLADMFRMWGDKTHELRKKASAISSELKRAKSTTIDTKLRDFAIWLKEHFKDPSPAWKYPIAPVEGFDDSSIHVAIKMYIDNVRMEKYLRPFNTFTQFRLRVIERLGNEGIEIPFPQRDIHIVELPDTGKSNPLDSKQSPA